MKIARERPNLWYLIVTLVAMYYLKCISQGLIMALKAKEQAATDQEVAIQVTAAFLAVLILCVWLYLIRDLIRQISLFFKKAS